MHWVAVAQATASRFGASDPVSIRVVQVEPESVDMMISPELPSAVHVEVVPHETATSPPESTGTEAVDQSAPPSPLAITTAPEIASPTATHVDETVHVTPESCVTAAGTVTDVHVEPPSEEWSS